MERVEIENSEHVPFYVWFDIDEDHAEDEKVEIIIAQPTNAWLSENNIDAHEANPKKMESAFKAIKKGVKKADNGEEGKDVLHDYIVMTKTEFKELVKAVQKQFVIGEL